MSDHLDRGVDFGRCEHSPLEAAFAAAWEKSNQENPGINSGHGTLQDLFLTCADSSDRHWLSEAERRAAATAIQWLGSNCGYSFLMGVLQSRGYYIHGEDPENGRRMFRWLGHMEPVIEAIARAEHQVEMEKLVSEAAAKARQFAFDLAEPS